MDFGPSVDAPTKDHKSVSRLPSHVSPGDSPSEQFEMMEAPAQYSSLNKECDSNISSIYGLAFDNSISP